MATYRTSKCPYCGYSFEYNAITVKEKIGHPFVNCPSCKKQVKTGMKYWKDFSDTGKIFYNFWAFFISLWTIFYYSVIALMISVGIFESWLKLDLPILHILIFLGVISYVSFLFYKKNKILKELKKGDINPYSNF